MVNGERVHVCIYENDVVFHEKMEDLVIVILSTWKIFRPFCVCVKSWEFGAFHGFSVGIWSLSLLLLLSFVMVMVLIMGCQ